MCATFAKLQSKLPDVKTTIFTTMGRLAVKHNAINLSQGFPNFPPDPKLLDLVSKAMNDGHNQYAPMEGVMSLRKTISAKVQQSYQRSYDPVHEITVTAGATQAIFTIITAFVRENDEVIIFKPAYDCYEPAIELMGGIPVCIQLEGLEHAVNWEVFANTLSNKTKMVIINTPHNPSGTIWSKEDMLQLQSHLKGTGIIVISDEVYEHIVFDDHQHQSAALFDDLASRSFICASFGKTFHITGWKIGYCVAPDILMHEFRKTHQFNVFCTNHPIQKALATYLKEERHYLALNSFYQQKRDFFIAALKGSRFTITPSQGTYFQLLGYDKITQEKDTDFAERLVLEHGVASIPISVFNMNNKDDKHLRFCFAKTEETLAEAAAVLRNI